MSSEEKQIIINESNKSKQKKKKIKKKKKSILVESKINKDTDIKNKEDCVCDSDTKDNEIETTDSLKPKVIKQNFKDVRVVRQNNNNKIVYENLINGDLKIIYKNINYKEFIRTLENLEITEETLLSKCKKDHLFAKITSMHISKNASRQGSKDETEQLRTCNIIAEKCGLVINNLNATDFRPTKDGSIISKKEMKNKKIPKDCCLKSFDGKISGKFNGFICAKVAFGQGGHQDNVFEEMDTIAEWWKKFKHEKEEILIILIDTDLQFKFNRIKEKYKDVNNVLVFNHIQFQQYMINTYYTDESK